MYHHFIGNCLISLDPWLVYNNPFLSQGIAYAGVAGLDAQYGLYSAFMGCFLYCIFGSSKDVTIGPTAIMALMTQVRINILPFTFP